MTSERKGSESSSRLGVKRSAKLMSKPTKQPSPSAISSPPKAALSASNPKKDEVHRRRNHLNDMLRHKLGDAVEDRKHEPDTSSDNEYTQEGAVAEEGKPGLAMKVAELEEQLANLDQELPVYKEETARLRYQLQVAQATVEKLQLQVAETHRDVEGETSQKSISSSHMPDRTKDELIRQNYDLRHQVLQLQDQVAQDATYVAQQDRKILSRETEWNDLRSRLHASEKESQERLQQLMSLKSSISSLTRLESQITDSELAEAFLQLANRTREWVITNFRRSKLSFEGIPPEALNLVECIVQDYRAIEGADKLGLYQAIVASSITEVLQELVVVGLPSQGPLSGIRAFADALTGPQRQEWKRVTVRALDTGALKQTVQEEVEAVVHRKTGQIGHLLFTLTSILLSPSALSALSGIIKTAVDLQRTMALQKARYQVTFFRHQDLQAVKFDDRRMELYNDMVDDDESDIERRPIFCIFPCLEKFGDEWGDHMETNNVILKARMLAYSSANG